MTYTGSWSHAQLCAGGCCCLDNFPPHTMYLWLWRLFVSQDTSHDYNGRHTWHLTATSFRKRPIDNHRAAIFWKWSPKWCFQVLTSQEAFLLTFCLALLALRFWLAVRCLKLFWHTCSVKFKHLWEQAPGVSKVASNTFCLYISNGLFRNSLESWGLELWLWCSPS